MGWTFPWYSSYGSRLNFDYGVSFDSTVEAPHYNYRSAAELKAKYGWAELPSELHERVCSFCVGERVFHTYSTYGRGTEQVGGTHYYLDLTALGRQEDWEEPKGRAESLGPRAHQRAAPAASGDRPAPAARQPVATASEATTATCSSSSPAPGCPTGPHDDTGASTNAGSAAAPDQPLVASSEKRVSRSCAHWVPYRTTWTTLS